MAAEAVPEIPITLCEKNLYLFNQYTGQCWSDATMVFLLFSEGLGPETQRKLQLPKAELERAFYNFAIKEKEVIQAIAGYDLDDVTFEEFIANTIVYIQCIKRRFENWLLRTRETRERLRPVLQRCDSMIYSLCQETAGPEANELLYPVSPSGAADFQSKSEEEKKPILEAEALGLYRRPVIQKNVTKPLLEKVETLRGREGSTVEALIKENVKFSNVRGYSPKRLGKLVAVLIYFFLDGATGVTAYSLIDESLDLKTKEDDTIKTTALYQSGFTYSFDIDPFAPTIESATIVRNMVNKLTTSAVVLVHDIDSSKNKPVIEGHAITLLECGGMQYLYDDNLKVLVQINWKDVFQEPYTSVYYMISKNRNVILLRYLHEYEDVKNNNNNNVNSSDKHTITFYSSGVEPTVKVLTDIFSGMDLWNRLKKQMPIGLYAIKDFGFFFIKDNSQPPAAPAELATEGGRRSRRATQHARRGRRQGTRRGRQGTRRGRQERPA